MEEKQTIFEDLKKIKGYILGVIAFATAVSVFFTQVLNLPIQPVLAIVLDRGVHGNSLDLLTESLDAARVVGRSSITYDVLREGYGS